jgi:eukaryotic-like serine/threonine-protein kinase
MLGSTAAVALLATVIWYLHQPLPPPHIIDFVQITHDGRVYFLGGTDGSRVYFGGAGQVSTAGGDTAPVPMAIPGGTGHVLDVSPDGANLLISQLVPDSTSNPLWNVRILGGSVRRLGGTLFAASFSPDGNWVAYVPMPHEIWLVRSDGTGAHRLISVKGYPISVSWSPDGSTIRFFGNLAIWEVSANGSNLHELLPGWRASSEKCCGRWTPDGKFYVFIVGKSMYWAPGTVSMGGTQIWALDERRGLFRKAPVEPVQLTSGPIVWGTPVPSKDGKKIFAEGRTLRGELSRFDSHSKRFEPFLGGISAEFLDFSKDGKSVAYVSFPEGILWRADRDGSNRVQLTEPPMYPLIPRWSPDGKQILFWADSPQLVPQIYTISSEGGSPTRLLPEDDGRQGDPNWSPDGRQIVYCCGPPSGREGAGHLNILDLASHKVIPVPGSEGRWSPRWSPDGRYLAAFGPEQPILRIFEFKTQRWSTIQLKGDVSWPTWSADSKFIYCMWNGNVIRIRVPGGMADRVVDLKDFPGTGYWNGAALAFDPTEAPVMLRNRGSSDIYALPLETK